MQCSLECRVEICLHSHCTTNRHFSEDIVCNWVKSGYSCGLIRSGFGKLFRMSQIIEFVGNHTLLCIAFLITLGMLVYTEYMRMSTAKTALGPYDATQKMNAGESVFLDVRDESEFKGGHLLNARSMPVNKLAERMHELEKFKNKDIVVYCDNGMRASRAVIKLKKSGFERLFTLAGGLAAWEKANLPTVTK